MKLYEFLAGIKWQGILLIDMKAQHLNSLNAKVATNCKVRRYFILFI